MCVGGWDRCSYQLREIAFIDFALPWPNTCYEVARKFLRGGVLKLWSSLSFAKNVRLWKFQFVLRFGGSAVAMHGHTFHRVPGHSGTVFRTVFPTEGCRDEAESSGGQCGEGGSRLAAGMGAVTEKLEGSVERSLVQGSDWRIKEAWGKSHDHRATSPLYGRAGDTNKSAVCHRRWLFKWPGGKEKKSSYLCCHAEDWATSDLTPSTDTFSDSWHQQYHFTVPAPPLIHLCCFPGIVKLEHSHWRCQCDPIQPGSLLILLANSLFSPSVSCVTGLLLFHCFCLPPHPGPCSFDVWRRWRGGIRAHGQPSVQLSEVCQKQGAQTPKSIVNTGLGLFLYWKCLDDVCWRRFCAVINKCNIISNLDQLNCCLSASALRSSSVQPL